MRSVEYLADGHHVDDAGNLIACTYVDFREPAERFPVTVLQKASSKRHAIETGPPADPEAAALAQLRRGLETCREPRLPAC